jgi:hypothetical protein
LEGATYMQIHEAGGGINFTVRHTKNSSEDELYSSFVQRLENFKNSGFNSDLNRSFWVKSIKINLNQI